MARDRMVVCPKCRTTNFAEESVCCACGTCLASARPYRQTSGLAIGCIVCAIAIPCALLAVMIFSIIAHERTGDRKAQCLTNTKDLALALSMYLADYDTLPSADQWSGCGTDYYSGLERPRPAPPTCQEAADPARSYAYNSAFAGLRPEVLPDPSKVIGICESDAGWNARGGQALLAPVPRHMGGDNVGFADGHAKWYPRPRDPMGPGGSVRWRRSYDKTNWSGIVWKPEVKAAPSGKLAPAQPKDETHAQ